MIVDMLLRVFGVDPSQFQHNSDKWVSLSIYFADVVYLILPYVLFLIPWVWLGVRMWKKKTTNRSTIIKVIVVSLFLLGIGFILPGIIEYVFAVLAIRSYYGM
ncbi:MAG: hypothetical protein Q7S57_02650 [bacterium]|nr:hypothetical protein [bacterium]